MSMGASVFGSVGARASLAAMLLLAAPALAADPHASAGPHAHTPAPLFPLVGGRGQALPSVLRHPPPSNPHGEITIACERCHTPEGWTPLRDPLPFDHSEETRFTMTGRHVQAACRSCHLDLRFDRPDLLPDDCASCHLDVHRGQLGDDCRQCHTTQDFQLVRGVEIHARTAFPLTGSHLQIACESCHADDLDGAFAPLDPACFACHADDYERTANSLVDHPAAGFPTDCAACHTTLGFGSAVAFDHAAASGGFSLLGAHSRIECTACHNPGDLALLFQPASQDDCFACHAGDYERTANSPVDHVAAGFPTDCRQCHTLETWEGATVDHVAVSGGFPLVGAHLALACDACHSAPDFSVPGAPASPDDCVACHADDHQAAHPGFPTTCLDCHTTTAFQPATFDHVAVSGGFDLVGAHLALDCSACHVGPDFEPIWVPAGPNDCYTCHTDDYEAEHAGSGFPTTCLDCHTTDTWAGATFDHSAFFPIYSGEHEGEWADCQTCHTQPGNFGVFTCLTCHEHRQSEMDDKHDDVGGYVYESNACYSCHPDGEE